jgi:phage baseplate assembly protein gpV
MQNCFKREADLSLSVSSGSSFEIDGGSGSINQLEVDLSSGAQIEIEEKLHINHLALKASSGSDFEADNEVVIETAKVKISSGATVEICGALEVSGKASSGGTIEVAENTIRTDFTTSSGGSLDVDC